jgi:hypothetical protein
MLKGVTYHSAQGQVVVELESSDYEYAAVEPTC